MILLTAFFWKLRDVDKFSMQLMCFCEIFDLEWLLGIFISEEFLENAEEVDNICYDDCLVVVPNYKQLEFKSNTEVKHPLYKKFHLKHKEKVC